ncbi:MAG: tetratricopeptide repeat protein [Bacteroidia bacterium]
MKSVKLFVSLFLLSFLSLPINANEGKLAFENANAAYAKKDFDNAILLYGNILKSNLESAALYYNLGNAYYQKNEFAKAILNYERAKKIAPTDSDILNNLNLANQKIEDKLEVAPEFFLLQWKNLLLNLMNEKAWSITCILLLCFACLLFAGYFISKNILIKQIAFYSGTVLGALFITTFFIAKHAYFTSKNGTEAIILSSVAAVNASPSENGKKLFILHAGSKVSITKQDENWFEITISNGNVGWIKEDQLEKI